MILFDGMNTAVKNIETIIDESTTHKICSKWPIFSFKLCMIVWKCFLLFAVFFIRETIISSSEMCFDMEKWADVAGVRNVIIELDEPSEFDDVQSIYESSRFEVVRESIFVNFSNCKIENLHLIKKRHEIEEIALFLILWSFVSQINVVIV